VFGVYFSKLTEPSSWSIHLGRLERENGLADTGAVQRSRFADLRVHPNCPRDLFLVDVDDLSLDKHGQVDGLSGDIVEPLDALLGQSLDVYVVNDVA
jgi:hypothetical protein